MFSKQTGWLTGLLATALIGPYAVMDENLGGRVYSGFKSLFADSGPASESPAKLAIDSVETSKTSDSTPAHTQGHTLAADMTVCDLTEALRFDVSPQWVTYRWPRVTTVLAETELQGLRVPLVTGTKTDDLAGSLTYYFDKAQRVQRITFQGTTGDARKLVSHVTKNFGLKSVPALGPGLYMTQWNGKPISSLKLAWPPVISQDVPNFRCLVELDLSRADSSGKSVPTSPREFGQRVNRW